jgi:hypothetical protein
MPEVIRFRRGEERLHFSSDDDTSAQLNSGPRSDYRTVQRYRVTPSRSRAEAGFASQNSENDLTRRAAAERECQKFHLCLNLT